MNDCIFSLKQILFFGICLMFLTSSYAVNDRLPDPKIKAGKAKVVGQIKNYHLIAGEELPILILAVPNPVTAEMGVFRTYMYEDGSFNFEVPVECSSNIGHLTSDMFKSNVISVGLVSGETTKLEITYDEDGSIKANMVCSIGLTSGDLLEHSIILGNFLDARDTVSCYKMTPDDFSHYALEKLMVQRLRNAITDSILSENTKTFISNECKLYYLKGCLLTYHDYITLNYLNFKSKEDPAEFTPQEPNRSYFWFLKNFNLNDPQYLYNDSYSVVLQTLLKNETLNIPEIKDTPVEIWLKGVKAMIADLIGSDSDQFYDLLVANAYAKQFNNELKPLSDIQKANIRSYFKKGEIAKILFRRNETIEKLEKEMSYFKPTINPTPVVSKETLMDAIVSKYKGKVVVVDFWATWCSPCMNAMKEMREVKREMKGKDIVFVYISNISSPKKLWEEKVKIIGGEHYYLNSNEWEYIMSSFGFDGIPSYLLYDKNGFMKSNMTGYPGLDKMLNMIWELLPIVK